MEMHHSNNVRAASRMETPASTLAGLFDLVRRLNEYKVFKSQTQQTGLVGNVFEA